MPVDDATVRGYLQGMKHRILSAALPVALVVTLAGCGGQFSGPFSGLNKKPAPQAQGAVQRPVQKPGVVEIGTGGQSAASLDTTTAAEKAAATAAPAGGAVIGTTVASLGAVTEQGFWLRTPLVKTETQGSVKSAAGASVKVTLIPIDGPPTAGSQISLAAMRALDLGLTDLPTLTVYAE